MDTPVDPLLTMIEYNLAYLRSTCTSEAELIDGITRIGSETRRLALGQRLAAATGNVIQHGPLSGYRLPSISTWREADNSAKLLGLYEQEVQNLLAQLAPARRVLVDLGGADGFYAVGTVAAGLFERSIVYELAAESRANISAHAAESGVADRVSIHGAADSRFTRQLMASGLELSNCVVLIDIEGCEFEVLTPECLYDLRHSHVIIEVHDFLRPGTGPAELQTLIECAQAYFHVTELRTGARDLSPIPLLSDHWTDTDRWLLCSESRAKLMSWLWFSPK